MRAENARITLYYNYSIIKYFMQERARGKNIFVKNKQSFNGFSAIPPTFLCSLHKCKDTKMVLL